MPAGNVSVEAVFEADVLQYVGVLELEAAVVDNENPENNKAAVTAKAPVFVLNK